MGTERSKCVEVFYEVEVKCLFEINYYNCKIRFCKPYDNSKRKASSRHRKDKWIEVKPHYQKVSVNQKQCQKQRKKGTKEQ